jgi:hypothetical protein
VDKTGENVFSKKRAKDGSFRRTHIYRKGGTKRANEKKRDEM